MKPHWSKPVGLGLAVALLAGTVPFEASSAEVAQVSSGCDAGASTSVQAAFQAASARYGVPESVLKAVSYMESRWDGHDGEVSADKGYGIFNIKDHEIDSVDTSAADTKRATDSIASADTKEPNQLEAAAALTGLPTESIKTDDTANICAGAALLADYAGTAATQASGVTQELAAYVPAITSMNGSTDFTEQVISTLADGASQTLDSGETVTLAALSSSSIKALSSELTVADASTSTDPIDCPSDLNCEWLEAPYQKSTATDPDDTGNYGNHDTAYRTSTSDETTHAGPKITYIIIHAAEGSYQTTVDLAQNPDYLAWNYTIRSSDGHVAQHLDPKDIGWHAGNWYINMHSIGIEHEGYSGTDGWYTESMYQSSAKLVKYLADEYGIPIDRAHILGHDQLSGTVSGNTKSMHWDPGPYWDWEHYFALMGVSLGDTTSLTNTIQAGDIVGVKAESAANTQSLTGCSYKDAATGSSVSGCVANAEVNYVDAYSSPSTTAAKAYDPAQQASGSQVVSQVASRVLSGAKLSVVGTTEVDGVQWVQVYWAGSAVWIKNPSDNPVLYLTTGKTITNTTGSAVALYGRAYPEAAAYVGTSVTNQGTGALESTIPAGQTYVISDENVITDYYNALTFNEGIAGDRFDVIGSTKYDQIWYGHRVVYVQTAGLTVTDASATLNAVENTALPEITGTAAQGQTLSASAGSWSRTPIAGFAYQWLADGSPIAGATGPTLLLDGALAGARISVAVTVSDPALKAASAVSAQTDVVTPKTLDGIAITGTPSTLRYKVGQALSTAGLVVTATYSDGSTADVTAGVSVAKKTFTAVGPAAITVSYAEGSIVKTAVFTVTVTSGTIVKKHKITLSGKAKAGAKLTVKGAKKAFSPTGTTISYTWKINGKTVKTTSSASYTIPKKAASKRLSVTVRATKSGYVTDRYTVAVKVAKAAKSTKKK